MGISCIILAGGRSSRMGTDKALAELAGRPLIGHVLAAVRPLFRDIVIVAKDEKQAELLRRATGKRAIPDSSSVSSPVAGVRAGIPVIRNKVFFLTACDMPFLRADFIWKLLASLPGHDCAVPLWPDGRVEPLAAVYLNSCFDDLELDASISRLAWRPTAARVLIQPVDERCFFNINSPADLEKAKNFMREQKVKM